MGLLKSPTWQRLEQRWDNGFESLMKEEQETIALYWLEAETMNGSMHQFFSNSSGDLAPLALSGLQSLNLPITLEAFKSALEFFGENYPINREVRAECLKHIESVHGEEVFTPASEAIIEFREDFLQAAADRLTEIYARI